MRAVQVVEAVGPGGVRVVDVPEPEPGPGQVVVEVHAVGVSFPDLLLSKGMYQLRPEPPFTLGVDLAGTVVSTASTNDQHRVEAGTRVAAVLPYGGAAERVLVSSDAVLELPDRLSFVEGAALPMNYLTALFALKQRGQVRQGETVLVHGASGGVGTATLQVARALGAHTIGVVSTLEKADFAREAGAHEVVLVENFKDEVHGLTNGRGVDVVLDVVGGDLFTDSLRCLAEEGRLLVVGFAAGQGIPEVRVNRLLLNNIDVRGVGWGAFAMTKSGFMQQQWRDLLPMIDSGAVKPVIGSTYDLDGFAQALTDLDARRALGKSVAEVRSVTASA